MQLGAFDTLLVGVASNALATSQAFKHAHAFSEERKSKDTNKQGRQEYSKEEKTTGSNTSVKRREQ